MAKQQTPPEDEGGEKQTSTRIYKVDNLDLQQLAAMLDTNAADAYRRVCAPVVRMALKAELRRKSAELDKDRS